MATTITTVVIAGFVGNASAQTGRTTPSSTTTTVMSPGHWTVTPFVGIGFSGDLDSATGALGAAAGYVWSDRLTVEGEFNVLPSSEANGVVEVSTHVWSLTGNALYHFSGRKFVPYGVVGIGFGHGSTDLDGLGLTGVDTSSTEFVLNFGGGVERRLTDRLGFRGDLRYFFGGDLVPDYWRLGAGITIDLGGR
ncbi:MAG TPA: outer membrane beta-barrel protein [Vicinamibacterales bacterium]|jgi:Outer membrane protein beta-barrel domain|nr:outer membrane beta-barrel protein [Vicinamibacterales bacterium]